MVLPTVCADVARIASSQGVLLKLYKASSEKKKTQQFLLEFVQDLVTDSPHADVRFRKTCRARSLPPFTYILTLTITLTA